MNYRELECPVGGNAASMSSVEETNLNRRAPNGPNSSSVSRSPIVITRVGIGRLTLGRCLHRRGVSFWIYDPVSGRPKHSYDIALQHQSIELLSLQKTQRRDRGIHHLAVGFHYMNRADISSLDTRFDLRANRCFSEAIEAHRTAYQARAQA